VTEALQAHGIKPCLTTDQGKAIALRSYVPQPVTKNTPERVYANTFLATVPDAIVVCPLTQEMSITDKTVLRREWAFVEADARTLLAFDNPPSSVPLTDGLRLPRYDWRHYEHRYNKRSANVVKELIWRSLEVTCVAAGLQWCEDRRKFYFPVDNKQDRFLSFTHVDGRKTRVAATGKKKYGTGEHSAPFLYQLCPTFSVGRDESGAWWVTMRIYVRITDTAGVPHKKKAISRRRKKVTKCWWNKEWFARTLAVMQALASGGEQIVVGSGSSRGNCLARPEPIFQGKIEGSPLHMPKIGPWRRKKLLISWEKPGVDALNNYQQGCREYTAPRMGLPYGDRLPSR
jgi:hypothetical protein